MFTAAETQAFDRLLDWALEEDLGADGDLTSLATVPEDRPGRAVLAPAGGLRVGEDDRTVMGPVAGEGGGTRVRAVHALENEDAAAEPPGVQVPRFRRVHPGP